VNLREAGGKVPIWVGGATPYLLIDFPSEEEFISLYTYHTRMELRRKFYGILGRRVRGETLSEAGKPFGVTKERVRQIEAKFLRLMGESYLRSRTSSNSERRQSRRPAYDNR